MYRHQADPVRRYELNDQGYHKLFETLFRISHNEKANYTKTASAAKKMSATRLTSCASVLRLAVEVGVHTIRYKTVRALIDHITQTLPHSDDHYCEPIAADYVKALRIIVEQQSHREHLSKEEWQALVDFCIDGVQHVSSLDDISCSVSSLPNVSTIASRASTSSTLGSSLGRVRNPGLKSPSDGNAIRIVDEFAVCLSCLMATSNAPIMDKASLVVNTLLELLHMPSKGGNNKSLFMSLNSVLARCTTEDINLAQHIFKASLPHIRRLWQVKSIGLKEEMLTTLIYGQQLMPSFTQMDDYHDYRSDLEGVFDICIAEYGKRLERDQLQAEDIVVTWRLGGTERQTASHMHVVELHSGSARSEATWALLRTMSSVFMALHGSALPSSSILTANQFQTPQKRRKFTSPIDILLNPLNSKVMEERVVMLQLLAFVMDMIKLDNTTLSEALEKVYPFLSSDDPAQASWSMIAVSWYVTLPPPYELHMLTSSLV